MKIGKRNKIIPLEKKFIIIGKPPRLSKAVYKVGIKNIKKPKGVTRVRSLKHARQHQLRPSR